MMTVLEDIFEEEKENDHSCPNKWYEIDTCTLVWPLYSIYNVSLLL